MRKFKKLLKVTVCLLLCISLQIRLKAQQTVVDSSVLDRIAELEKQVADRKPGQDHFMVVGLATFGFVANKTTITGSGVTKTNSLADADHYEFSPMLLWRHGTKFLLEFEPSFDGNQIGVNWANISWFATPGLIVHAGYFVLPFGSYNKRLAAGWIDKLPTDPAGVADLPPASDFGIGISGGFPLGSMKWSYDISLTNGFQLLPDGEIQNAGIVDNNKNKTLTGRFSLLPFSNSSLEIGVSGLFGKVGDDNTAFQNVKTNMYAVDVNYVKLLNPILVNFKGQYNWIDIDKQTYMDASSNPYTFDNKTNSGFAQLSLRPSGSANKVVKNLEAAFRIGNYNTPKASLWGQNATITEFGLLYWLNWRTVFKVGYTLNNSNSTTLGSEGIGTKSNSFIAQFSIQL